MSQIKYMYYSFLDGSASDTKLMDEAFDELPEVKDCSVMHAQYLLQTLVEDKSQPLPRRLKAAKLVYGIALDQTELNANDDLKPLFNYGGGINIAEMLVDAFRVRCPDGKCTGSLLERDYMTYVYDEALKILNKGKGED